MSLLELQRRRALRVPADSRPGARLARRRRGVPARSRAADPNRGLRAAEPLRRLPRGAVRAGQARLRPVAAHQVPVVRRARRARLRDLAIHGGKSLLISPETARLLDPLCRAELARREDDPLLRHLAEAGPSELDDLQLELGLAPKELRRLRVPLERCGAARRAQRCLRGAAPAHERAGALGPALPGAGRGRRAGRARDRRRSGGGRSAGAARCRAGSRGGRTGSSSGWSAKGNWCARRTAGWRRKSGAATKDGPLLPGPAGR